MTTTLYIEGKFFDLLASDSPLDKLEKYLHTLTLLIFTLFHDQTKTKSWALSSIQINVQPRTLKFIVSQIHEHTPELEL